MAEFPALPFWTDAYLGDTTHLTTIEHGAYFLLLIAMWRSPGCRLPNDPKLLARYCKLTNGQWNRISPVLMRFFDTSGDYITQGRLTDEAIVVRRNSARQSDKARSRWLKNKGLVDAVAMPDACRTHASHTHNHTHIEEDSIYNGHDDRVGEKKPVDATAKGTRVCKTETDWPTGYEDEFWKLYPRKVAKEAAMRVLARIKKHGAVKWKILIDGVWRYQEFAKTKDIKYVKHPATWLNAGCWDDELTHAEFVNGDTNGHGRPRPFQDDRLSISKAADRLIEKADKGEFQFGPRPKLFPDAGKNIVQLLPKGRGT